MRKLQLGLVLAVIVLICLSIVNVKLMMDLNEANSIVTSITSQREEAKTQISTMHTYMKILCMDSTTSNDLCNKIYARAWAPVSDTVSSISGSSNIWYTSDEACSNLPEVGPNAILCVRSFGIPVEEENIPANQK